MPDGGRPKGGSASEEAHTRRRHSPCLGVARLPLESFAVGFARAEMDSPAGSTRLCKCQMLGLRQRFRQVYVHKFIDRTAQIAPDQARAQLVQKAPAQVHARYRSLCDAFDSAFLHCYTLDALPLICGVLAGVGPGPLPLAQAASCALRDRGIGFMARVSWTPDSGSHM